jgi:hypothetical protein
MFLKISAAAAALVAATALAGAASAQDQSNAPAADQAPPAAAPADTAPAAAPAPVNAPAVTDTSTSSTGYNVRTPQTDPNTGAQIVSNGPVPDTRANRARFGQPDSHAGRRTKAAGN